MVGPGRSGTDFLFGRLRQHPQIAFPEGKEGEYYRSLRRLRRAQHRCGPEMVLADIGNHAYRDPRLPQRVRALTNAGVKVLVVVVIRDHVERAKSMMLFRASRGEPSAWLGRGVLERSVIRRRLKPQHISAIYESGADVIAIDFAMLVQQTRTVLERLTARCGIDPVAQPSAHVQTNASVSARWMPLSALGKLAAVTLRRIGARRTLQRLKDSPDVQRLFFRDASVRPSRPDISAEHTRLLREENGKCWEIVAQAERGATIRKNGEPAVDPAGDE